MTEKLKGCPLCGGTTTLTASGKVRCDEPGPCLMAYTGNATSRQVWQALPRPSAEAKELAAKLYRVAGLIAPEWMTDVVSCARAVESLSAQPATECEKCKRVDVEIRQAQSHMRGTLGFISGVGLLQMAKDLSKAYHRLAAQPATVPGEVWVGMDSAEDPACVVIGPKHPSPESTGIDSWCRVPVHGSPTKPTPCDCTPDKLCKTHYRETVEDNGCEGCGICLQCRTAQLDVANARIEELEGQRCTSMYPRGRGCATALNAFGVRDAMRVQRNLAEAEVKTLKAEATANRRIGKDMLECSEAIAAERDSALSEAQSLQTQVDHYRGRVARYLRACKRMHREWREIAEGADCFIDDLADACEKLDAARADMRIAKDMLTRATMVESATLCGAASHAVDTIAAARAEVEKLKDQLARTGKMNDNDNERLLAAHKEVGALRDEAERREHNAKSLRALLGDKANPRVRELEAEVERLEGMTGTTGFWRQSYLDQCESVKEAEIEGRRLREGIEKVLGDHEVRKVTVTELEAILQAEDSDPVLPWRDAFRALLEPQQDGECTCATVGPPNADCPLHGVAAWCREVDPSPPQSDALVRVRGKREAEHEEMQRLRDIERHVHQIVTELDNPCAGETEMLTFCHEQLEKALRGGRWERK